MRNRWKSLRDSYVKETKYKLSLGNVNAKPKKDWRYSQEMSFLAPHISVSRPSGQNDDSEIDIKTEIKPEIDEHEPMEAYFVDPFQINSQEGHFMGALLDYSAEKVQGPSAVPELSEETDVDAFFKGVAQVVKRLNPGNQVKIQKDIVNMVLDAKLKEVQQNNNDTNMSN